MSNFDPLGEKNEGVDHSQFLDLDRIQRESSLADGLGLPFTNRFACLLNAPPKYKQFKKNGWLEFQVMDVTCPNFSLSEGTPVELNGIKRYYFMGRNDLDLEIVFLETPDLLLRRFFYSWLSLAAAVNEDGVYRHYLEEYTAAELLVYPLDNLGKGYYADKFIKIFPFDVNSISYSYSRNDLIKTTVKFKSMFHHLVKLDDNVNYHQVTRK